MDESGLTIDTRAGQRSCDCYQYFKYLLPEPLTSQMAVLVSPVLAGLAVGIGVPILLFYVYGVVPVSLCRSGGCGVTTSGAGVRFDFDDENDLMGVINTKPTDADTVSHPGGNPSIGEASLSLGSGSQLEREADRESASMVALAGSIISSLPGGHRLEVQADVASNQRFSLWSETTSAATSVSEKSLADDGGASTRALAGSVLNFKVDGGSLSNYRGLSTDTPVDSVSMRSDANMSLSSLEELASGLMRKVARRKLPADSGEDGGSERVRFDDHVSFIEAERGHCKVTKKHSGSSTDSVTSSSRPSISAVSSLRSLFFHSSESARADMSRPTTSKGESSRPVSAKVDTPPCLPVIPEPLTADHVTISIPEP
ncbi:E3 ubiquitin-protein ligase rnf19b [Homalodisca vitripennis]|nr:E3 ubiquitin-protein ligase rnf19b [Homalodisca vitripennis]